MLFKYVGKYMSWEFWIPAQQIYKHALMKGGNDPPKADFQQEGSSFDTPETDLRRIDGESRNGIGRRINRDCHGSPVDGETRNNEVGGYGFLPAQE